MTDTTDPILTYHGKPVAEMTRQELLEALNAEESAARYAASKASEAEEELDRSLADRSRRQGNMETLVAELAGRFRTRGDAETVIDEFLEAAAAFQGGGGHGTKTNPTIGNMFAGSPALTWAVPSEGDDMLLQVGDEQFAIPLADVRRAVGIVDLEGEA